MTSPILFTERLILRPAAAEDFESWAAFSADAVTMRHLGGVQNRAMAWRSLCTVAGAWTIRGYSYFSVVERVTGHWVGRVGPWQPEGWPGPEIGYGLLREFTGKGYATEAVTAAANFAVNMLGWDDVMHTIDPENLSSIAVAKRIGARNRGPTRLPSPHEHIRVDNWGQSAAAWRARAR